MSNRSLTQRGEKPLAIQVILENLLALLASIHHVINRARVFHAQFAGHAGKHANSTESSQYQELTPFKLLKAWRLFTFLATAPQLDLFTQRVNGFTLQKANATCDFIDDLSRDTNFNCGV